MAVPFYHCSDDESERSEKRLPIVMVNMRTAFLGLTSSGPHEEPMWVVAMVNNHDGDRS